eukprot:CAMPEP_0170558504 /NCGR_PEP_ID=MMETSP0211-20121228/35888_1 /TAXON_ID=311385 /ORGANISM="Pseudokeronopsis sp., Strain OXSARD2" /LENGTH=76 /DNA_ID=CAMNT_0010870513 /DNA_START=26 /DNA_END=256 /DNA_ORIENTATION=-
MLEGIRYEVKDWSRIVIAYEPVWAISSGKPVTPEMVQESHDLIRKWILTNVNEQVANSIKIIYGGHVTEGNAEALI